MNFTIRPDEAECLISIASQFRCQWPDYRLRAIRGGVGFKEATC